MQTKLLQMKGAEEYSLFRWSSCVNIHHSKKKQRWCAHRLLGPLTVIKYWLLTLTNERQRQIFYSVREDELNRTGFDLISSVSSHVTMPPTTVSQQCRHSFETNFPWSSSQDAYQFNTGFYYRAIADDNAKLVHFDSSSQWQN